MNFKNFIIGGVLGGLTNFLLGWIFYGNIFKDIYPENENTNLSFIFLGCMTFGLLISYIYTKWAGINNPTTGFSAGAIIGLFNALSMNFFMFSNKPLNMQNFAIDVLITVFIGACIGAVVALVNGRLK
jgi:hypothetical protein